MTYISIPGFPPYDGTAAPWTIPPLRPPYQPYRPNEGIENDNLRDENFSLREEVERLRKENEKLRERLMNENKTF